MVTCGEGTLAVLNPDVTIPELSISSVLSPPSCINMKLLSNTLNLKNRALSALYSLIQATENGPCIKQ
jgi:hypothetical protein